MQIRKQNYRYMYLLHKTLSWSNRLLTKKDGLKILARPLKSGYCDSNTGPSGPKPDALANCATPRK